MARILLTGAAGFIGIHILKSLVADHEVVAIDNLTDFSNYEIKLKRLAFAYGEGISFDSRIGYNIHKGGFLKLDILDKESLKKLFLEQRFDIVIHLAAMTGIRQSVEQPDVYESVNVRGFFNIIECCREYNVERLLFASSSSVYGNCKDTPFTEGSNTDTPLNLYAATKKMNELMAHTYASLYQLQCIGLRFFTVYGPWARPDMATHTFIKSIANGQPIKLFNSGNMQRDFTYVGDIAEAIRRLVSKMINSKIDSQIPYKIFNIGASAPVNLKEYVETIQTLMDKKAIIENYELQKGEMINTYSECSALYNFIGFRPEINVRQGLAETIYWYRKYDVIS